MKHGALVLMRIRPAALSALAISARIRVARSLNAQLSGVSCNWRGERLANLVSGRASNRAIGLLTADGVMPATRAAGSEAAFFDHAHELFHLTRQVGFDTGYDAVIS